jgi:hypothetical protein
MTLSKKQRHLWCRLELGKGRRENRRTEGFNIRCRGKIVPAGGTVATADLIQVHPEPGHAGPHPFSVATRHIQVEQHRAGKSGLERLWLGVIILLSHAQLLSPVSRDHFGIPYGDPEYAARRCFASIARWMQLDAHWSLQQRYSCSTDICDS